jgi:outer membrane lipoprotein-sorting protein
MEILSTKIRNNSLKKLASIFSLSLIFLALILSFGFKPNTLDATEVVRRADQKLKGKTSYAEITIQIVRPTWTRELAMKSWTKGDEYALILVTAPAKEKGNISLKRDKEVWSWMPSIERNIKLPPSMMLQSWMGTDFTNDDLVKQSSIVNDYEQSFGKDSIIEGRPCYRINMRPKPNATVVWGKVVLFIDKTDFIELKAEYYDEDEELVNVMLGSNIKLLGGKLLASKMEMIPVAKPGNKTVFIYTNLKFDIPLEDNFFTVQNMKTVK